jgi:tetratricopeptide (TPR) repeat protein
MIPAPLELARRAIELAAGDPGQARVQAIAALAVARSARDPAAMSVAYRALGLAERGCADARAAALHLRRAVRLAGRHELPVLAAEARMSLALVLDDLGRPADAVREIDAALASLRGLPRARSVMQRALILHRLGRDDEAMRGYRLALRTFRAHGDRLWQARTLNNRGNVHGYRGNYRLARADLLAAADLYAQLDLPASAAQVQHNLGFVAAQAGDVPEALARYEQARGELSRTGPDAVGLLDLAELLRAARLLPEADEAARAALAAGRRGRLQVVRGQAGLLLAGIALDRGRPDEARVAARAARRAFTAQGRPVLAAHARVIELTALAAAGRATRATLRALRDTAGTLDHARWPVPAWDSWLDSVRLAVALGDGASARDGLRHAAAAARRGPAALRTRLWHMRALVDLAEGNVADATSHASAGLREFAAHRASLGAAELRVRSGADVAELAEVRLRLALRHEPADQVLVWSSRCKAATLWLPPARPSHDPAIARDLAQLRHVHADLAGAPTNAAHTARLLHRQRELEASVRRRSWQARGAEAEPFDGPSVPMLAEALDGRALVDLLVVDAELHAVTLVDGQARRHRLGPLAPLLDELAGLRFALRRLVTRRGHTAAAAAAAEHAATELDRRLLAPLDPALADRELVLAPTSALHALPWPLLARCRDRVVHVTPSAVTWWRATRTPEPTGPSVLVGAPEPPHAAPEVRQIAAGSPGATVFTGTAARVTAVLPALDGARIGHLACHGQFRADNALFSALRLADGPLTIYDLSGLRTPPGTLVLSGCDTGLSTVHPGDELIGLTSALLQLGTRAVIASTGPVDDEATRWLMTDLHARTATGTSAAAALAAAQAAADPAHRYTAASFVCFGGGG